MDAVRTGLLVLQYVISIAHRPLLLMKLLWYRVKANLITTPSILPTHSVSVLTVIHVMCLVLLL